MSTSDQLKQDFSRLCLNQFQKRLCLFLRTVSVYRLKLKLITHFLAVSIL